MSTLEQDKKKLESLILKMPSVEFKNEHGEKFVIYSNGVQVFMGGDEVDKMVEDSHKFGCVISLFNSKFNVWNKKELYNLGKALMELHKEVL